MIRKNIDNIVEYVSRCLQLAILLEVSSFPKPGNVHRVTDFNNTKYEHFLASAIAIGSSFRYVARKGIMVSIGKIKPYEVKIGKIIKDAVKNVNNWQHGGNTLLGTIILFSPIGIAVGMTLFNGNFSITNLRKNIKKLLNLLLQKML